jgi:hypothetical protein
MCIFPKKKKKRVHCFFLGAREEKATFVKGEN